MYQAVYEDCPGCIRQAGCNIWGAVCKYAAAAGRAEERTWSRGRGGGDGGGDGGGAHHTNYAARAYLEVYLLKQ